MSVYLPNDNTGNNFIVQQLAIYTNALGKQKKWTGKQLAKMDNDRLTKYGIKTVRFIHDIHFALHSKLIAWRFTRNTSWIKFTTQKLYELLNPKPKKKLSVLSVS